MEGLKIKFSVVSADLFSYQIGEGEMCTQEGFVVRREKTPEQKPGVITFDEVKQNLGGSVTKKIGKIGLVIVQYIVTHGLAGEVLEIHFVHPKQLHVLFKERSHAETELFIGTAIASAFGRVPVLYH